MRTNIEIDNELMEEALKVTGSRTKREVVDLALRELVQRRRRKDMLELVGKVSIREDYDHKAMRAGNGDPD
jgi:Arc/MetJ family transcription regulator